MSESAELADITELGRQAVQAVVGDGVIDRVEVRPGTTFDYEPTYEFYFRIDRTLNPLGPGMTLLRLTQHLQNLLGSRGDETIPVVHLLNESDWRYFEEHA